MAEGGFRPPGDPGLRHVLEIQLRVPLIQLLSGIFREVRCARLGGCAVARWQEREVAPRIVHEAAAERDRETVVMEPRTVVEHRAEEIGLVRATRAVHAAA